MTRENIIKGVDNAIEFISNRRFSEEANLHYRFKDADSLVKDLEALGNMVSHHKENQVPRLKVLLEYYEGENTRILSGKRRKEEDYADHRSTHAFAEYVSGFIQGYLVGIPLKTSYPDEQVDEELRDINRTNDADEHNSNLVLDQSIYGRAYELLYRSQSDEVRFTISDVLETFIIYDNTVEMNPIAGVRYIYNQFSDKEKVYLYTVNKVYTIVTNDDGSLSIEDEDKHHFGGVPIIEYSNNRFRRGDFEKVIGLIDLYDAAQSDTANYMTDLNDALLVIRGNLEIDTKKAKDMKKHNILMLEVEYNSDGSQPLADADYIYKKYDVQGTEKYKERVKNDIHMFTYTPNMDDESFAGTQSGESLKYKLFGLEQKRATKERLFKKSLRNRYRLINNILDLASEGGFDVNEIDITFTPNLPKNLLEEIKAFVELGGQLSEEKKLSLLSFVDNPQEEMEAILKENKLWKVGNDMYNFHKDVTDESEGENEVHEE